MDTEGDLEVFRSVRAPQKSRALWIHYWRAPSLCHFPIPPQFGLNLGSGLIMSWSGPARPAEPFLVRKCYKIAPKKKTKKTRRKPGRMYPTASTPGCRPNSLAYEMTRVRAEPINVNDPFRCSSPRHPLRCALSEREKAALLPCPHHWISRRHPLIPPRRGCHISRASLLPAHLCAAPFSPGEAPVPLEKEKKTYTLKQKVKSAT